MSKIIVAEIYARGNVGSCGIGDEILGIAEKVMEIWESKDFKSAVRYVKEILNLGEDYEFDEEYNYEINEEKKEILIYNKKMDKYGNSWGYEEVLIKDIAPKLIKDKKNCLSWVEEDKQYFVEEIDTDEWVLYFLNETFDLENKRYLTANKVKKIIKSFFDYLEEHFKAWPINGDPIVSNNPYAYGYDGYECEIDSDYLIIRTESTCRSGAGFRLLRGCLILKKLKSEKEK